MQYYSTRDRSLHYEASEAVKLGLSRDGGLLTPRDFPQIDEGFLKDLMEESYQERAARVLSLYLTDYTMDELRDFAKNAYGPEKFDTPEVAPLKTLDE